MSTDTDSVLLDLLVLRANTDNILNNRESTRLEFKQSFSFGDQAAYAKTMLGFANNRGGFLVFGVKDQPHELMGIDPNRFATFDPVHLTSFLSSHASTLVEWEFGSIEFAGVTLGYIRTEAAVEKPVIVTSNHSDILKEGDIYYRYAGQTKAIRHSELMEIINMRLERERRAWMAHLEAISRAGPTNVGILDTVKGEMYGGGKTFLIDEALVRQLKFIRQGSFDEIEGGPTLRLVGNLHEVSSVVAPTKVLAGIHMIDLIEASIDGEDPSEEIAASLLEETADQSAWIAPVFRFARAANLDVQTAVRMVQGAKTSFEKTRENVAKRLLGQDPIERKGEAPRQVPIDIPKDPGMLAEAVDSASSPMEERAILIGALHLRAETVVEAIPMLPVVRLCEALMHVEDDTMFERKADIRRVAQGLLEMRYETMQATERSDFRRAVAYLDQQLYSWHVK